MISLSTLKITEVFSGEFSLVRRIDNPVGKFALTISDGDVEYFLPFFDDDNEMIVTTDNEEIVEEAIDEMAFEVPIDLSLSVYQGEV